jgi:hypothetical protein
MFSCMIVDNTSFEEEQEQRFAEKGVAYRWRKTSDPNHPSTYALIKKTIN